MKFLPSLLPMRRTVLAALFSLACIARSLAHDPGLSTAQVRLLSDRIDVVLVLSVKDAGELVNLDHNHDGQITRAELAAGEPALTARAVDALEFRIDDHAASIAAAKCSFDGQGNASLHLKVATPATGKVHLRSRWLALLPPGHRQFLSIQDASGRVLAERLLSANSDSATIDLTSAVAAGARPASSSSFLDFLGLGLKHILIGYDHLLFLFTLLIVSRKFMATLKLITCFTVAHSITLALATFDIVQLPARVVEPLIAASIIFVAIANLVRGEAPQSRLLLVFAFGLIHGLGFASVLRELGVGTGASGVAVPLLSFNLGVELGQLLIALPLVALLRRLNERPVFVKRWVPACSIVAALAGGFWFLQRV